MVKEGGVDASGCTTRRCARPASFPPSSRVVLLFLFCLLVRSLDDRGMGGDADADAVECEMGHGEGTRESGRVGQRGHPAAIGDAWGGGQTCDV